MFGTAGLLFNITQDENKSKSICSCYRHSNIVYSDYCSSEEMQILGNHK